MFIDSGAFIRFVRGVHLELELGTCEEISACIFFVIIISLIAKVVRAELEL